MSDNSFDCIVLGAGPGGYVAAIRASQLGLKTAVIEKEAPGGVCLNWGCIPSKALLKSAEMYTKMQHAADFGLTVDNVGFDFGAVIKRSRDVVAKMTKGVEFLLKKNNVTLIKGTGAFTSTTAMEVVDEAGKKTSYTFKNAIIATGGRARSLPNLPIDGERIITYRHALALKTRPDKILIIGAGAIGMEFAYFYNSFGAEVTVVEMMDSVLPLEDKEISQAAQKALKKAGINFKVKTAVESIARKGNTVTAKLKSGDKTEEWSGDYALVAIGFQGNVENIGLEKVGVTPERSFIEVDEFYHTGVAGIYAIGDIIGAPLLAHVASHEGIIAAEHMAGQHPHAMNYNQIPAATFCQPQVASIGMTEEKARELGYNVKVGRMPFSAIGKAVATNTTEGLVKVVIDADIEEVLGIHICHADAAELIGEGTIIQSHEGIASSVFNTVHAHPTAAEAIMEAMGDALGRAIHI